MLGKYMNMPAWMMVSMLLKMYLGSSGLQRFHTFLYSSLRLTFLTSFLLPKRHRFGQIFCFDKNLNILIQYYKSKLLPNPIMNEFFIEFHSS